jgi:predicted  nucleic acid-binding Zn-ribbon protein
MPVKTDDLNEDIKELKVEVRDIRSGLDVLKADVHRIDVSLAELRSDVRNAIKVATWGGSIFVLTFLSGGVGAIWSSGALTTKVSAIEIRGTEKIQETNVRIDKMESRIEARFDRLEASIDKILEQTRPVAPKAQ